MRACELNDLPHAQRRWKRHLLRCRPDLEASAPGSRIAPEELDDARIRAAEAEEQVDRRGLAGSVRPEEGDDLRLGDGQREVVERRHLAVPFHDVLESCGRRSPGRDGRCQCGPRLAAEEDQHVVGRVGDRAGREAPGRREDGAEHRACPEVNDDTTPAHGGKCVAAKPPAASSTAAPIPTLGAMRARTKPRQIASSPAPAAATESPAPTATGERRRSAGTLRASATNNAVPARTPTSIATAK